MNQVLVKNSLEEDQKSVLYAESYEMLGSFLKLYQSLLLVMREEQKALLFSSLEDVKKTHQDKEFLILKIQQLENKKKKWAVDLLNSSFFLSSYKEVLSFSDIVSLFKEGRKKRLQSLFLSLSALMDEIQELNASNKSLLESSLKHLNLAFQSVQDFLCEHKLYRNKGEVRKDDWPLGRLMSREV